MSVTINLTFVIEVIGALTLIIAAWEGLQWMAQVYRERNRLQAENALLKAENTKRKDAYLADILNTYHNRLNNSGPLHKLALLSTLEALWNDSPKLVMDAVEQFTQEKRKEA